MRRLFALPFLCGLLFMPGTLTAQEGGTGSLTFIMNSYGRIRLYSYEAGEVRHVARLSGIYAIDSSAVFDYYEDAEEVDPPVTLTDGIADTIVTGVTNGTYSLRKPDVTVRSTIYAWSGDNYVVVRHTYRNDASTAVNAYIGVCMIPQPAGEYGFETVAYDEPSGVAYFYRTGQDPHVGLKVLSGPAYSFHSMDWELYSPDPDNDYSNDSIRAFLTIPPGFDDPYEAGPVGSVFHFNAGMWTLQPGDTVAVDYALMYALTADSLFTLGAEAQQRHDAVFTSVEPVADGLPEGFALRQNYPNPFNPSTQIRFDLPSSGFVTLKVYDLLGREVETLVNQELNAGSYEVPFSGDRLPSGTYIATMQSGNFRASTKMLLMK